MKNDMINELQEMVESLDGKNRIEKAAQCLIDNGIDKDEAMTVLQSIGYILADVDLWPENKEAPMELKPGMKPDDFKTGAYVESPRGLFSETALSVSQMESLGYGEHHRSTEGKYIIMGNGTRAFAVRIEQTPEMKAYCRRVIAGEEQ